MASYTDQVKEILKRYNCEFERQGKGDHEIWRSPINGKRFPVDGDIRSRHTANGILRQAGINEKIPENIRPLETQKCSWSWRELDVMRMGMPVTSPASSPPICHVKNMQLRECGGADVHRPVHQPARGAVDGC